MRDLLDRGPRVSSEGCRFLAQTWSVPEAATSRQRDLRCCPTERKDIIYFLYDIIKEGYYPCIIPRIVTFTQLSDLSEIA